MLENLSELLRQCYEHAEECARQAKAVKNKKLRADYLRLEERWLKLARSYELGQRLKLFINEAARRTNDLKKIEWQPIYTAPFNRDLELAELYGGELHILDFPCRRILGGWVNAVTRRAPPSAHGIGGIGQTLRLLLFRAPSTTASLASSSEIGQSVRGRAWPPHSCSFTSLSFVQARTVFTPFIPPRQPAELMPALAALCPPAMVIDKAHYLAFAAPGLQAHVHKRQADARIYFRVGNGRVRAGSLRWPTVTASSS